MIFAIRTSAAPDFKPGTPNSYTIAKILGMEQKMAVATTNAVIVEKIRTFSELDAILDKYNVNQFVDAIVQVGGPE